MAYRIALASELDRLTPAQRDSVTHILADDGEWSEEQISAAVADLIGSPLAEPDFDQTNWKQDKPL